MKNLSCQILFLFLFAFQTINAQNTLPDSLSSKDYKNSVRLTPFKPLLFERLYLAYEKKLKNNFSLNYEAQVLFYDRRPYALFELPAPKTEDDRRIKCQGFSVIFEARKYLGKRKKFKTYFGAGAFYGFYHSEVIEPSRKAENNIHVIGTKLSLGIRVFTKQRFYIDFGLDMNWLLTNKDPELKFFSTSTGEPSGSYYPLIVTQKFHPDIKLLFGFSF